MMRRRHMLWLVILELLIGIGVVAVWWSRTGIPPIARLCVVNTLSQDLSVIDPVTQQSVARIPLQAYGYAVAVSRRGDRAYVTTSSFPMESGGEGAGASQLLVVDLERQSVTERIPIPDLAPLARVHLAPSGRMAYLVTAALPGQRNLQRGRVIVVDLASRSIIATIHIGINPLDSVMTPDGRILYTADWGSKSISVINLLQHRLADTIPITGSPPRLLTVSHDGSKVYAGLDGGTEESLLEIDTRTREIVLLPSLGVPHLTAMAITSNGQLYLAGHDATRRWGNSINLDQIDRQAIAQTNPLSDYIRVYSRSGQYCLIVYDLNRRVATRQFDISGYIASMAAQPNNNRLYLVGSADDGQQVTTNRIVMNSEIRHRNAAPTVSTFHTPKTVTVLDLSTGDPIASIPVGAFPQGCALSGD